MNLKVITLNCFDSPLSSKRTARINHLISEVIKLKADVICFQELIFLKRVKRIAKVFENNGYYYTITSPSSSTKSLAGYAKQYDETLYYLVYNHRYTFRTDSDVKSITENCLLDTAKYTLGLVKYVRD